MKKIDRDLLKQVLHNHKLWLKGKPGGVRAILRGVNLHEAELVDADLHRADLVAVDLSDTDLQRTNLSGAGLTGVNLHNADLRGANLTGAYLDFASWPLWCGSIGVTIDERLSRQLVYHAVCNLNREQMQLFLSDPIAYANGFHRVGSGLKQITVQKDRENV